MGTYLNVGNAGFESAVKGIYVDKTKMIAFINSTSFAAQMLCAYYDKSCDSRSIFEGLAISKAPSFEKYLNKYDVIYLDRTWSISSTKDMGQIVDTLAAKGSERTAGSLSGCQKREYIVRNTRFHQQNDWR